MLAVGLAAGLMLTSGVGVVLASQSLGGHDNDVYQNFNFNSNHSTSCVSEHKGYWSYSQSWKTKHSTLYLTVLWDCKHLTYTIKCGSGFKYKLGGGSWYDVKGTSYSDSVPPQPSGIYIQADGTNFNVPFNWQ